MIPTRSSGLGVPGLKSHGLKKTAVSPQLVLIISPCPSKQAGNTMVWRCPDLQVSSSSHRLRSSSLLSRNLHSLVAHSLPCNIHQLAKEQGLQKRVRNTMVCCCPHSLVSSNNHWTGNYSRSNHRIHILYGMLHPCRTNQRASELVSALGSALMAQVWELESAHHLLW